ncbi:MAG: NAD(P)/FAD-dependent oxidoreductase [Thermomicrobiales bacterium]
MTIQQPPGGYDAVIVGGGPNGLSAGITLASRGLKVVIFERNSSVGGGARTTQLTEAGFHHDVCSAIHPLGAGSPFFRRLPLDHYGLEWVHPEIPAAHPLDDGTAVAFHRSIDATAANLDVDAASYRRLMTPLAENAERIFGQLLRPLRPRLSALAVARFGLLGLQPSSMFARRHFSGERARALFAGMSGHSVLSLDQIGTSAFGLSLMVAGHTYGWPFPRGGSQALTDALASYFQDVGGEIQTNVEVQSLDSLPGARIYLFDTTPRQLLDIAGGRIGGLYRRQLRRYRYGPGVFKIDYALSCPIPWTSEESRKAGTVHLGGTFEEVAASERAILDGRHPARPFVLVAQQSLFDGTRAPDGNHTAWVYCHAPHGSTTDLTDVIERQIERFAPGFGSLVIARNSMSARDIEQYNPNYIGGDISAGSNQIWQILARPALKWDPYATSDPAIFLCSASTPPGGGVHGMSGYWAARSALGRLGAS